MTDPDRPDHKQLPLITIGMTAYNAADTIGAAMDSALAQDWPQVEIVIVDDASSDETAAVIQGKAARNSSIKLFTQLENKGVAAVRNRIIAEAKGEFIAFFDDDDVSVPERLRRQYERLINYERDFASGAPVVCHTARTQLFEGGRMAYAPTMGADKDKNKEALAPHGPDVAARILTGRPLKNAYGALATCSQMARRQVYLDLGGFDENYRRGEDTDFSIRLALAGGHFVGIKDPLVRQAMTAGQEKTLEEERRLHLDLFAKHRAVLNRYSSYGFCLTWLDAKYDFLGGRKRDFVRKMLGLALRHPIRTAQRLLWALPNIRYNLAQKRFYDQENTKPNA